MLSRDLLRQKINSEMKICCPGRLYIYDVFIPESLRHCGKH